ncbi:MAG: hypothetical protein PF904_16235, partial [Kiritimatiellae bacterium]|jgi:hypothetical protein|nr:hypothetical protein [Kiritimatiellia bacterium]
LRGRLAAGSLGTCHLPLAIIFKVRLTLHTLPWRLWVEELCGDGWRLDHLALAICHLPLCFKVRLTLHTLPWRLW